VNNSSSSMAATQQVGPGQGRFRAVRMLGGTTLTSARNVEAHVGYEIIGYGFGAALAIAAIGSALPAFLISKVRPAEVMRAE
jgi:ABC-type antimicrobial peptide transport system permease subunit